MNLLGKLQSVSLLSAATHTSELFAGNRRYSGAFLNFRGMAVTTRRSAVNRSNEQSVPKNKHNKEDNDEECLLNIGPLYRGEFLQRPAVPETKSPYIARVRLIDSGKEVLAWAPALDVGGLCMPGSIVWLSAKDTSNGKETMSSHTVELIEVNEPETESEDSNQTGPGRSCLIGASPGLGEKLAYEVLQRGLLESELGFGPAIIGKRQKASSPKKGKRKLDTDNEELCGTPNSTIAVMYKQQDHNDSRIDVELEQEIDGIINRCLIEVKNVVCSDYSEAVAPVMMKKLGKKGKKYVFTSKLSLEEYRRCGLFPIGMRSQEIDGQKVVSERAIKHVRNLANIVDKSNSGSTTCALLFVLNRSDCDMIRTCEEACAVFAKEVSLAKAKGVQTIGFRVKWKSSGHAYFDGSIPVLGV